MGNPLYSAEEQQQAAAEIILIQKELECTILHELGHALKQSHTFSELDESASWIRYHSYFPYIEKYETEVLSVMNYTPPQIYEGIPCETYCVSVLDKYNLIVKWGISS